VVALLPVLTRNRSSSKERDSPFPDELVFFPKTWGPARDGTRVRFPRSVSEVSKVLRVRLRYGFFFFCERFFFFLSDGLRSLSA